MNNANYNNMHSLKNIRSPLLQNAFHSIRLSVKSTTSLNRNKINNYYTSMFNNNLLRNNNGHNDVNNARNEFSNENNNSYEYTSISNNLLETSTNNNNKENNSTSQSINQTEENNNFRYELTIDNKTSREIHLNHIPQRLNNQFDREFTYNVPDNTHHHNPFEEANLLLDIYLYKDTKFTKIYANQCNEDKLYLEDTNFKFSL